ncbi:DNA ligase [Perilla frutescens var. frutescens]|nr:DNA ligase [Perilla frutescens var. frutescens]
MLLIQFQCPKQTFATLFYNLSSSFFLIFIFFHFTSIFLAKLFTFFGGNPFYQRNQDGYEFNAFSDEEEVEEENNEYYRVKAVEINDDDRGIVFVENPYEPLDINVLDDDEDSEESSYTTPAATETCSDDDDDEVVDDGQEINVASDTDSSSYDSQTNIQTGPTSREKMEYDISLREEENFLVYQPGASISSQGKKLVREVEEEEEEKDEREMFGDTLSTSKDSSEWRSSINCGTEDPFSSSSRRSCPKWESYTVFQKYDEEMLFLDRITAQKLSETGTYIYIYIVKRIVHKITSRRMNNNSSNNNPYRELECAYVAQICLTWEALNWNYKHFQGLRVSRRDFDKGCPAYVAQQFQQFQVLLQRYVENEPYEHGRRPDIYARIRSLAPKLLQVPQYTEEGQSSRIPSTSFLHIMEESIRTFMDFLKQDKKNHYQILRDFFKRNRKGSADATLLLLLKKVNKKKKAKLNELCRSGKCLRKRRLRAEEELEILMAQIDLKVVSRVLRMAELNGEQLHWCENKMSKVRVSDGKLQRDSSPLFFPAQHHQHW